MADRLRRERTLTLPQVAERLQMGSWKSLNNKLYRWRKAGPASAKYRGLEVDAFANPHRCDGPSPSLNHRFSTTNRPSGRVPYPPSAGAFHFPLAAPSWLWQAFGRH